MSDEQITSLDSAHGRFLPGLKPVSEALTQTPEKVELVLCRDSLQGREIQRIQTLCQRSAIRFKRVPLEVLDGFCRREMDRRGVTNHQGIVARLSATSFTTLEELTKALDSAPLPMILALDQIQDPGNLGTLARTFYILGGAGLLLPSHNSASLGPQASRSAAGALERMPVCRVTNLARALDSLEEGGCTIYGTARPGPKTDNAFSTSLCFPAVLVLGNEERGIRPEVSKRCSHLLSIPQKRIFDSFNVAQAGAILLGLISARKDA